MLEELDFLLEQLVIRPEYLKSCVDAPADLSQLQYLNYFARLVQVGSAKDLLELRLSLWTSSAHFVAFFVLHIFQGAELLVLLNYGGQIRLMELRGSEALRILCNRQKCGSSI